MKINMLKFSYPVLLLIIIISAPCLTHAQITVPADYTAEVFAQGLKLPINVKVNKNDELFAVESGKHRILKISQNRDISVFAQSTPGAPLDFRNCCPPFHAKMDFAENGDLYAAVAGGYDDPNNSYGDVVDTLYKISPGGVVERIARQWLGQNLFYDIAGLSFGPDGYLYMADLSRYDILKVDLATKTSTRFFYGIQNPLDILFDKDGNLYAAAHVNYSPMAIYRFAPDGTPALYTNAFSYPVALTWGPDGYLYVLDGATKAVYTLNPQTKEIKTFASGFYYPYDIEFDSHGNLFVADPYGDLTGNGQIVKIAKKPAPKFSNVRIIDTIASSDIEVVLSSATKTPYSVRHDNQNTVVEWRFDSFDIKQTESISFDLNLFNLIAGENRLIDHSLELIYTDYNGQEVKVGLPSVYVHVLESAFNSAVTTDKTVYGANQDVLINSSLSNLSEYGRTIDAKIIVEDIGGNPVKEVTAVANIGLAAGETKTLSNIIFNTGNTYAGQYRAHLILYEGQQQVGEATANFLIQPSIAMTSALTTDKISYSPNQAVTLTSTLASTSPNYIFENLTATITIKDWAYGSPPLHFETLTIPILMPGQLVELKTYWNTSINPKGTYTVKLEVFDGGTILSASATTFGILSSQDTGDGLIGTITATANPVYQGRDETVTYTITNKGNEDIANLKVKALIVNPDTQEIKNTFENTIDLSMNATVTGNFVFSTSNLIPGVYLVILQTWTSAMPEGKTLSSTTFEVKPSLEVTKTMPDVKNILVWLNYSWQSGQNCPERTLIEQALNEAGVSYHVVLDKKDFETELGNPFYTDFLVLGDHGPIEDHFSEELREQVYSGKGLLSSMFNRQDLDGDMFGIKFNGKLSGSNYPVELLESEMASQGSFQSYGRALKVEFLNAAENIGWILETTKKETTKYPGVIRRKYGDGKVLFYAFDLGLSSGNYSQFADLLKNSLTYIHKPLDTTAFHPNQLVPIEIKIKSLGGAFDLRITETYPADLKLYDPLAGIWIADNPWTINTHLESAETKTSLYYVLLPNKSGTFTLKTEIGYMENELYNFYQDLSTEIVVDKIP